MSCDVVGLVPTVGSTVVQYVVLRPKCHYQRRTHPSPKGEGLDVLRVQYSTVIVQEGGGGMQNHTPSITRRGQCLNGTRVRSRNNTTRTIWYGQTRVRLLVHTRTSTNQAIQQIHGVSESSWPKEANPIDKKEIAGECRCQIQPY